MTKKETYMLTYYEQLPQETAKLRNIVRSLSNGQNQRQIAELIAELQYLERIIAEWEWMNLELQVHHNKFMSETTRLWQVLKDWIQAGKFEVNEQINIQGIINFIDVMINKLKDVK